MIPTVQNNVPLSALIVDDDAFDCEIIARAAAQSGCKVRTAGSYTAARADLQSGDIDLCLVDLHLTASSLDKDGLVLIMDLQSRYTIYIIVSQHLSRGYEQLLWDQYGSKGLHHIVDKGRESRWLNAVAAEQELVRIIKAAMARVVAERKADGLSPAQLVFLNAADNEAR
jgi:CheY-like chemotaxis protein